MNQHYHTKIIELAEHKQRVTQNLIKEVGEVAEDIAESVTEGTLVTINKLGDLEVINLTSNIGSGRFLALRIVNKKDNRIKWKVFTFETPGSRFFFHDDEKCEVIVANREEYLLFANHMTEIKHAFNM